jgi:hypothetical protein
MTQKTKQKQWLASGCFQLSRLAPSAAGSETSQEAFFFFSFYACQNCQFEESP